jgi:hypothetical protein
MSRSLTVGPVLSLLHYLYPFSLPTMTDNDNNPFPSAYVTAFPVGCIFSSFFLVRVFTTGLYYGQTRPRHSVFLLKWLLCLRTRAPCLVGRFSVRPVPTAHPLFSSSLCHLCQSPFVYLVVGEIRSLYVINRMRDSVLAKKCKVV